MNSIYILGSTDVGRTLKKLFVVSNSLTRSTSTVFFAHPSNQNKLSDKLLAHLIQHFSPHTLAHKTIHPDRSGHTYACLIHYLTKLKNKKTGEFYRLVQSFIF